MDHPVRVHVFKSDYDARNEELSFLLIKPLALILMKPKISACHKVSDEEYVHVIGKRIEHIDQEPV